MGGLIGGAVGLATQVIGCGMILSMYAANAVDTVKQAVKDYREGNLDWKKALLGIGITIGVITVTGIVIVGGCKLVKNAKEVPNGGGSTPGYNGYEAKLDIGQQRKHIPGTNEYKTAANNGKRRSIMYGTESDIQELLNDFSGKGKPVNANKERVDFGRVIGQYCDPETQQLFDTTIGMIHYGNHGAHIIPARPK